MKKLYIFALVAMLFAACTTDETQDVAVNIETPDTLVGTFEDDDTRIQLNEAQKTVWTKDDLVSVFYRSNANQKWQYQGETGERTGNLKRVANAEGTQELSDIVVVYPYNENYYINPKTNNVQASLPAVQTYLKDSYGLDGNIMVSQSEYNQFSLKNVCGWLKIQLTGNGEKVQSIKLKGNNGEQVAGEIYINSADATSTLASEMGGADDGENSAGGNLVFDDTILTEVVLNCGEGVTLSSEATAFYIALPPQTFESGVTVEIRDINGYLMTKSTNKEIIINRNAIQPMAAFGFEGEQPNNVILYMATAKVEPNSESQFGANIVSNIYENGKGVITFDGDVTLIGKLAFDGCRSLTSVTIPDSVTSIGNQAFSDCNSLTSITIPNSVTSIGGYAFYCCTNLSSVTIGNGLKSIGNDAFFSCVNLTNLDLGNSITSIGSYAFGECCFTDITIPESVTEIGECVFNCCHKLTDVYFKPATPPSGCSTMFFGRNGITNGVTIYVPYKSVEIYKSADDWKDYANYIVGYDFEKGEVVQVQSNNEIWYTATEKVLPYKTDNFGANIVSNEWNESTGKGIITFDGEVTSIGAGAFASCYALKSINIPNSIITIDQEAFVFSGLETITIPDSVTSIGPAAFESCGSLTSVTIPDSVTSIGGYAFARCTSLEAFYGKLASSDNRCLIVNGVLNSFAIGCGATAYTIPDSVTSIGGHAFSNCSSLISVAIPDSVTSIGRYAFYYCTSLTSVTIPDSVIEIGEGAFCECNTLRRVYCKAVSPPIVGRGVFRANDYARIIYVPTASAVRFYQLADGWSEYADRIEEKYW
ncbi:MAG: leucine-rich repeat domain-containing protein [Alistipes sp.]|nr:leucine-rich repeat domain-containing protein [Alistipes sp.]